MKLEINERLILLSLPIQGTIADIKLVREFKESLSFDEQEQKEIKLRSEGEMMRWDGESTKDVEAGDRIKEIIEATFERISQRGKFLEEHLPLYERFMEVK